MWRKLLKLRPLAANFLKVDVKDGCSTYLWFDNWLSIGPLIDISGEVGTRLLGIRREAKVSEVIRGNNWALRRSRNRSVQDIITYLRTVSIPNDMAGQDRILWK
ncbi:unnamed protein product [Arabis nemorensis]|uniref:Reverse transcriptase zinc-binding domain-containing protein n=1 Tax=Arabis nemorensis TaxID=586526 RepID=A0A565BU83_9BRAS|nr:unnamed protein product [Arabis nemorensis]